MKEDILKFTQKFGEIKEKVRKGASFLDVRDELKSLYVDIKETIERLEELLEEIKGFTISLKEKTDVKEEIKREEVKRFVQSLKITDVDVTTYLEKGWNAIAKGNYDEAISILEEVKEYAPENTKVLALLGWAYVQKGEFDSAIPLYLKVLSFEPNNTIAMKDIGYICYKKGIYGEAIEHLAKVVRIDNDPTATLYALYYLGLVYLDREMYDDAIDFLKKAIERGPNLQEAYYHLGLAYEKKGEFEKSKEFYRRVIEISPETEWAKKAQKRLEYD
jgi:tetratricopeptide (TPR) repeat protein